MENIYIFHFFFSQKPSPNLSLSPSLSSLRLLLFFSQRIKKLSPTVEEKTHQVSHICEIVNIHDAFDGAANLTSSFM
jgi:hypothetical protein